MKLVKDFSLYVGVNILGQVAYSCYTMADTFFVAAACGATGLAALNLAFPIFCLINGLGLCLGIGGGSQYVLYQTQARQDKANQVFSKTIKYGLVFSILCIVSSFLFAEPIVYFLGADSITFSMTHTYVKILLLFAPGFLLNTILQAFVRNDGGPLYAMASMLGSSLFNIVFDAYFIFVLDWGIFGAILATSLAPWASVCILSLYWIQKQNQFSWQVGIVHTKILSSGLPFFFNECASAFLMFFFNFLFLNTIGTIGVSAFSIVTVLSLAVTAIFNGCSQGIQPLLSRQAGIQNKENIRRIFKYGLYTIFGLSLFYIACSFSIQIQSFRSLINKAILLYRPWQNLESGFIF